MTLVVDASVAVKWFVEEIGSAPARALLDRGIPLIAPELILAEVGNALWKHGQAGRVSWRQAERAAIRVGDVFDTLVPLRSLAAQAFALARSFTHPVYDCFYLALAEMEKARLVTYDQRLLACVKDRPLARRVVFLEASEGVA
jgi:predicted nucleic acid-binding protein